VKTPPSDETSAAADENGVRMKISWVWIVTGAVVLVVGIAGAATWISLQREPAEFAESTDSSSLNDKENFDTPDRQA
jgi:flagellar basal body-associated protein FliL